MHFKKNTGVSKTRVTRGLLIGIVLLAFISRPLMVYRSFLFLATGNSSQTTASRINTNNGLGQKCAYVFYASDDAYACGALVNMARLQKTLPRDVDMVMVAFDSVSNSIREVATQRLGALVYNTSSFGKEYDMGFPIGRLHHYRHCYLKFLAFLLPRETYRRLIMMDADSLVLRPPHHLFNLPDELPLAVPSAYWLRPQFVSVTNWFMSVRPSKELYIKLQRALQNFQAQGRQDIYDMDLLNEVFAKEITVLPPIYGLLDSEFGENDEAEFGSLEDILEGKTSWAVHFTAGKPMLTMLDSASVANENPNAHVGHAALFEMWNAEARSICPQGTYPSRNDRDDT